MMQLLLAVENAFVFVKGQPFSFASKVLLSVVACGAAVTVFHSGLIWTAVFSLFIVFCGAASCLIILDDQNGGILGELRQLIHCIPFDFHEKILGRSPFPVSDNKDIVDVTSCDLETGLPKVDCTSLAFAPDAVLTSHSLERIYPWLNLTLPRCLDNSLTNLLEIIITDYVAKDWYPSVQVRKSFSNEVRLAFRFGISRVIRRLRTVDCSRFVHQKVVKALVEHVSVFLNLRKLAKDSGEMDLIALLRLHPDLAHPFMKEYSDEAQEDLFYYRIATKVLSRTLPRELRHFKPSAAILREVLTDLVLKTAVDAFSEPHRVNYFLGLALSRTTGQHDTSHPASDYTEVPIAKKFITDEKSPTAVPIVSLQQILKEPTLKSSFEEHLKHLHLQEFCRIRESISWINQFLDSPVLGATALTTTYNSLVKLHGETEFAQKKGYSFPAQFLTDIATITASGPAGVPRLRQLASWKDLNEKLTALFDGLLVPSFQDTRLYHHLMMPPTEEVPRKRKVKQDSSSASRSRPRAPHPESLHKLGETVRGVLSGLPPVVDPLDNEDDFGGTNDLPDDDLDDLDDEQPNVKGPILGATLRDLSYYDVSVLRAERRRDDRGKIFMILNITVYDRGPLSPENNQRWAVQRRYSEFYILDAKIREFHGAMNASNFLPPKKAWSQPSLEFLQQRLLDFERFLQSLLKEPKLRYSQMLYNFLTTTLPFDSNGFPDLGLGKVTTAFLNVPQILTQERGQNIEPFVRSLLNTALPAKPRGSTDLSSVSREDILSRAEDEPTPHSCLSGIADHLAAVEQTDDGGCKALDNIFDQILYLATALLRVHPEMMGIVACCHSVAGPYVKEVVSRQVSDFVEFVQDPHFITDLIDVLTSVLTSPAVVIEEQTIEEGRMELLEKLLAISRSPWAEILCGGHGDTVARVILDLFQHKILNKRLIMILLDLVVVELFPEVDGNVDALPKKASL